MPAKLVSVKKKAEINFGTAFTLIFLGVFAWLLGQSTNQHFYNLKSNGILTNAELLDIYVPPKMYPVAYTVRFYANNQQITVTTNVFGDAEVGDSLPIIYNPNNPKDYIMANGVPMGFVGYYIFAFLTVSGVCLLITLIIDRLNISQKNPLK